ncbi:AhpC/TSA family protein [Chryseobacterium sp. MEBOG06]|uniref:peroxiredoxin-like family protein n=1 Tax=Chryseobacterium sp. MEBOG06 TaxID=2879938 RepID=UPI001F1DC72B|nr:peroxiredoxin-like family protein [Chryseobacterium sp. MEBOG06]UKB83282.1 AhpC/TSA family protein [Chryseobacterium sp. MEBOG06]
MNTLSMQIEKLNSELFPQLTQETLKVFGQSIQDLKTKSIEQKSIQIGEKIPEFSLPNAYGEMIDSSEILKKHKMILVFYRGGWCPYCNLELNFLQKNLPGISNKNTVLVAISPQSPGHSLTMAERNKLEFEVLTDFNNAFAEKLGIVFQLQDFVIPCYQDLGINLSDYNKNENNTLPVPAIFVVDKDRVVTYKFLDANYMNRVDMEKLLQAL